MNHVIDELINVSGTSLSSEKPTLPRALMLRAGKLAHEFAALLGKKNGFFAFGSALHFFPTVTSATSWGLVDWNEPNLWKIAYASFVDPGICFAEDIFGNQFCIQNDSINFFEVETGTVTAVADSLEEWARIILADNAYWTGQPLADQWSIENASIAPKKRLHPAIPFICGGVYEPSNLKPIDAAVMMLKWGDFARQVHLLPDGAEITFTFA